jgi:hypothetical protein
MISAYRPSLSDKLQAPFYPKVENRGQAKAPRSRVVASGCLLFRWRSHQKAAFASGDFIDVCASPHEMTANGRVAATIHVPLQWLAQGPRVLDAAIWIPQSCWAGG